MKQHVESNGKRAVSWLVLNYGLCGNQNWKNSKLMTVWDFVIVVDDDDDDDDDWVGYDSDVKTTVMTKTG